MCSNFTFAAMAAKPEGPNVVAMSGHPLWAYCLLLLQITLSIALVCGWCTKEAGATILVLHSGFMGRYCVRWM